MSLLLIAAIGALIIGFLIGVLVGTNNSKKVKSAIDDVKASVDDVHTKSNSMKDDIIAVEGRVKDLIDFAKPFIAGHESQIVDSVKEFGKEQIKELDELENKFKSTPIAGETKASPTITVK